MAAEDPEGQAVPEAPQNELQSQERRQRADQDGAVEVTFGVVHVGCR